MPMRTTRTPDTRRRVSPTGRALGLLILAVGLFHLHANPALADPPFKMADALVCTIVIDKQSGRFAHIAAGAFPAEVHALSEIGTCRSE